MDAVKRTQWTSRQKLHWDIKRSHTHIRGCCDCLQETPFGLNCGHVWKSPEKSANLISSVNTLGLRLRSRSDCRGLFLPASSLCPISFSVWSYGFWKEVEENQIAQSGREENSLGSSVLTLSFQLQLQSLHSVSALDVSGMWFRGILWKAVASRRELWKHTYLETQITGLERNAFLCRESKLTLYY